MRRGGQSPIRGSGFCETTDTVNKQVTSNSLTVSVRLTDKNIDYRIVRTGG